MIAPAAPSDQQIGREFQDMLPELTTRLHCRFLGNHLEARAEYVAEAVALAWKYYRSARQQDKVVRCSPLAFYAARSVLAGRRLAGSASLDAFSQHTASQGSRPRPISLSDIGEDCVRFCRIFGDRRARWPVVDWVAASVDWGHLVNKCSQIDRKIIRMRGQGYLQTEIADALHRTPAAVCLRLGAPRRKWGALSSPAVAM